jgi:hypothetical protein
MAETGPRLPSAHSGHLARDCGQMTPAKNDTGLKSPRALMTERIGRGSFYRIDAGHARARRLGVFLSEMIALAVHQD